MSVVGIDIGNAFCVVAAAGNGGVDVILNEESKRETPACVALGERQRFLGAAAASPMPGATAVSQIKRLIGRPMAGEAENDFRTLFPKLKVSEDAQGYPLLHFNYGGEEVKLSPTQLLAMLLGSLKRSAERALQASVSDCCIGVPAHFNDVQRRAVLHAADIAGLRPLRLLHESSAAALEYGIYRGEFSDDHRGRPHVAAFVDVGHSASQVAIARFRTGEARILARAADPNLGGRDFDEVLFNYFAAKLKADDPELDVSRSPRASTRLRTACEKLKKVLSANPEAPLQIECLMEDKDASGLITRDEFESLCGPLFHRLRETMRNALEEAGLTPEGVDAVELIGSGSRVPAVVSLVGEVFRQVPRRTLNASECVARGCALQAAMLSPAFRVKKFEVSENVPFATDLSWKEVILDREIFCKVPILLKADCIPTERTQIITLKSDTSFCELQPTMFKLNPTLAHQNSQIHETTRFANDVCLKDIPESTGDSAKEPHRCHVFSEGEQIPSHKVYELDVKENAFSFDLIYAKKHVTTTLSTYQVGPFDLTQNGSARLRIACRLNYDGIVSVYSVTVLSGKDESSESEDDKRRDVDKTPSYLHQIQSDTVAENVESPHAASDGDDSPWTSKSEGYDYSEDESPQHGPSEVENAQVVVPFTEHVHGAFSKIALEMAKETETTMAEWDKQVERTKDQKNSLESYVYEMRNKVNGKYREFVTDTDRNVFIEQLQVMERWLYDDGEDVEHDAYAGKLKELKRLGDPIEARFQQSSERGAAVERLHRCTLRFWNLAEGKRPEFVHITKQEKLEVQSACATVEKWLRDKMALQDGLSKFEDPVVTVEMLRSETETLDRYCKERLRRPPHVLPKRGIRDAAFAAYRSVKKHIQRDNEEKNPRPWFDTRQTPHREDEEEDVRKDFDHQQKVSQQDKIPRPHCDALQNQGLKDEEEDDVHQAGPSNLRQMPSPPPPQQFGFDRSTETSCQSFDPRHPDLCRKLQQQSEHEKSKVTTAHYSSEPHKLQFAPAEILHLHGSEVAHDQQHHQKQQPPPNPVELKQYGLCLIAEYYDEGSEPYINEEIQLDREPSKSAAEEANEDKQKNSRTHQVHDVPLEEQCHHGGQHWGTQRQMRIDDMLNGNFRYQGNPLPKQQTSRPVCVSSEDGTSNSQKRIPAQDETPSMNFRYQGNPLPKQQTSRPVCASSEDGTGNSQKRIPAQDETPSMVPVPQPQCSIVCQTGHQQHVNTTRWHDPYDFISEQSDGSPPIDYMELKNQVPRDTEASEARQCGETDNGPSHMHHEPYLHERGHNQHRLAPCHRQQHESRRRARRIFGLKLWQPYWKMKKPGGQP